MAPIQQPDLSWPWHLQPTLGKDQLTDIRIRAVGGFLRNAITQEKSFTYFLKNRMGGGGRSAVECIWISFYLFGSREFFTVI